MNARLDVPTELAPVLAECERITRERARNFWYGLKLTPGAERGAMYVIYAWMRAADDLADAEGFAPEERVRRIAEFRKATDAALAGEIPDASPIWRGLAWVAERHQLSQRDFHDMLDGQLSDVGPATYQSWDDLRGFCYRVASTVGLVCIRIWGYHDPAAPALAVDRGIAFQLTNILRDYREDYDLGRVYLPAEDFRRFDLTPERLRGWKQPEQCAEFMRAQCDRAEQFYARSAPLDQMITPSCLPTLWAMTQIYHGLLVKIRANPSKVVSDRRVRLSSTRKAWIAWRASRMARGARA
ncbi:MAG: phytoene/squalene synthase family protein [Planctomycetota bacterium]